MSDEMINEKLEKETQETIDNEDMESTEDEDDIEEIEDEETKENSDYERLKDSFQRLQADFTNYKRRQENEKQEIYKYASESLITKLLSVKDNFDRALEDVNEEDPFVEGVKLIRDEFNNILESEGLEEIESDNEKFDANLHHAVFMEENEDVDSEHIIETFQKGYKLKDKVIRPAMVKVSK